VYFFSDRWSVNYETSRYLLREIPAKVDSSKGFAKPGNEGIPTLDADSNAIIALVGVRYVTQEDANVARMYPDASRYEGPKIAGNPSFVAYVLRGDEP
jgi:hypothetical protein